MPVQPPQWTDFLSCPLCCKAFNGTHILPVSLGCGHTICKLCIGKLLQRKCPFDQFQIVNENGEMPVNAALLFLLGEPCDLHEALAGYVLGQDEENYIVAMQCILELAAYLKPLVTVNNFTTLTPSSLNNSSNGSLSRPMQRKLVTLISCQLLDDEGRAKCLRAARSLGERTVTELILQYQNQQQLSANLWAAVRGRGCQFLGPAMQEEVLRLILLALEDGSSLSRKVLVLFVVQKLEGVFSQASKTSIGHVVQLLYRASCFTVFKRDDESSLMQLKEEFRTYEQLRREHDSQIVQIATEAGLRIAPDQWSSLLYGDSIHKSHMQSIIDKLQTPESFSQSIKELMYALQRSNDTSNNANLQKHLEQLATIDMSPDAPLPTWSSLADALHSARVVLEGLFGLISDYTPRKSEPPAVHNAKYKTSICRDNVRGSCPRGANCTFAHGDEELERFRTRSKKFTNQRVPIDHVTTGKQESVPVSIATQKRMPHYNAAIYKASATTGHSVSPSSSTANLNNSSNTGVNSDYSEEKLQATQHIANVTPRMMTYELPAKNFLPGVAMYRSPRERQSEVQAAGYHFHHAPPSRGEYSRHKEQGMYQRPTPDTALRGLHQRRGELLERLQKAGPGYNATLDGYVEETTASEMNDQERYNHWASGYGETSIRAVMTPVIPRMMSEPTYTTSKVRNTSAGRHRSEFPDQFIPFDPPIVSKFGPIARGKDSAKFRLAEPVQAFSSQAEPMTPVTAITPTTRPFPSPSPVPSMYTCIQGQANDIVMDPYTGEPIPGNKIAHVVPVAQLQPNGQANLISPRQNQGQRVTSIAEREQLKLELGQVNQKIDKLNEYSQLTHELQMVEKSIFETEQRHQPQPSDAYAKYPNLCVLNEGHRYPTVCDIGPDYQYTETVNVAPNPGMYTHMPASVPPSALSSFVYREGNI